MKSFDIVDVGASAERSVYLENPIKQSRHPGSHDHVPKLSPNIYTLFGVNSRLHR